MKDVPTSDTGLIDCHGFDPCCCAIGCNEVASILVALEDSELPFCGNHWQELRQGSHRVSRVLEVLDRPDCFTNGCSSPAVSVMTHLDGTGLPVCENHLDDLSWVTPTDGEVAGARLSDD